jgi:hypothetical protein
MAIRTRKTQFERRIKVSETDALREEYDLKRSIAGIWLPSNGSHTTGGVIGGKIKPLPLAAGAFVSEN